MNFNIAFDKNKNIELMLYRDIKYKDNIFYLEPVFTTYIKPIGSLLLDFLNTNFENNKECKKFICNFCFEEFYYNNHQKEKVNGVQFKGIKLSAEKFNKEISSIIKKEKNNFIYVQNIILKNLNLPYDKEILKEEKNEEFNKENEQINLLIDDLNLDFNLTNFILSGISVNSYNMPYLFKSSNFISILAIEFKEFISINKNTIKKCKNCGKYFIPKSLKETKYCNNKYKDNKTCKQIGKEITYKNSLKKDKLLDMYRKRYLSLASSVSHYGTEKAISKFENYKKEGAIIKQKYINKEISEKEFEKWIESTKI